MKKILLTVLALSFVSCSTLRANECLEAAVYEMNEAYQTTGCGCEDGIFNAVSASMLGWGVGLFAGIALLTGLVHNSHVHAESSNSSSD